MAEKKKAFSVADYMKPEDVSKSDTPAATGQVVEIPIHSIQINEKNFYDTSNVAELVKSIALNGLIEPIIVMPTEPIPGATGPAYRIISGHRRFSAWWELSSDDPVKYAAIPAIIRIPANEIMEELLLIEANRATRVMSSADTMKQAERYTDLLSRLKEQGVEIPGRLRDVVAEAMNISASRLARLNVIRNGLVPQYMQLFEIGILNESVAYEIARLRPEYQQKIPEMKAYKDPKSLTVYNVPGIGNTLAKYFGPAIKCQENPDPVTQTIGYCSHGTSMWERSKNETYNSCAGCCALCYSNKSCKSVCPIVAPKVEKAKAEESEKAARNKFEKAATAAAWDKFIKTTWTRIKEMRFAAGVDVESILSEAETIASTRGQGFWLCWEAEEWADAEQLKDYYDDSDIFDIDILTAMANLFHCSVDYLICRTDDPTPVAAPAGWRSLTDDPPAEGQHIITLKRQQHVCIGQAIYHDGKLYSDQEVFEDIDLPDDLVIGWIPFPEV